MHVVNDGRCNSKGQVPLLTHEGLMVSEPFIIIKEGGSGGRRPLLLLLLLSLCIFITLLPTAANLVFLPVQVVRC